MINDRTLVIFSSLILLVIFLFIWWASQGSNYFLTIFPLIDQDIYYHVAFITLFVVMFVLIFAYIDIFNGFGTSGCQIEYGLKLFLILLFGFFITLILSLLYTQGDPDNLNVINDILIALLLIGLGLWLYFYPFKLKYSSETDWIFMAGFLVLLVILLM